MKKETFWSLILEPDWVQAALWSKSGDNLNIISSSKPAHFEDHEMIEVIDSCLTDAISDFPEDEKEPSKTVFGVPAFWVKDGSIEREHLDRIREVCTKLSLSPSGFVVLSEAVAHSIKVQEGSPLTGVVLNLSKNFVSVSIFKLGNLVGTVNVGRSVSVFEDVIEGLSRFDMKEPLPTRFVLLGGDMDDVDDQNQELIKSDWTDFGEKNLRFLHTPQFEILDQQKKAIAISIAGASELGEVKNVEYMGQKLADNDAPVQTIKGDDDNLKPATDITAEDIGFVIDDEPQTAVANQPSSKVKMPSLPKIKNPLSKPDASDNLKQSDDKSKVKVNKFGKLSRAKVIGIGFAVLLIASLVSFAAAWWYLPKAEVTIFVSPKRLEANEAITLDENVENVDPDNMVFLATAIETQVSESQSKNATGSITRGDKATGRVTIRNGTDSPIQIGVGDSVYGPNDLEFVVLESASVSGAISTTEPGSATVEAEAADIGAEYNIAKDESLSVGSYSVGDVDAVVNEAFSGGSSEEIVAISQNDLDILESELLSELKRKGISQLESEVQNGRFIPESVETEVISEEYSGSVGDEASSVSLTLELRITGISILDETVNELAEKLLSEQVPEGFSLRSEQVDADFELVDVVDEGLYDFDVVLSANLLPEISIDDIKTNIMGKYPPEAEEFLSSIQGFSKAEVSLNPRFPARLGVLPRIEDNISIQIEAER